MEEEDPPGPSGGGPTPPPPPPPGPDLFEALFAALKAGHVAPPPGDLDRPLGGGRFRPGAGGLLPEELLLRRAPAYLRRRRDRLHHRGRRGRELQRDLEALRTGRRAAAVGRLDRRRADVAAGVADRLRGLFLEEKALLGGLRDHAEGQLWEMASILRKAANEVEKCKLLSHVRNHEWTRLAAFEYQQRLVVMRWQMALLRLEADLNHAVSFEDFPEACAAARTRLGPAGGQVCHAFRIKYRRPAWGARAGADDGAASGRDFCRGPDLKPGKAGAKARAAASGWAHAEVGHRELVAALTSGLCGDGRIPERFRIELASPNHKLLPLFPGEMVLSSKVLAWLRPSHATLVQSHIYFCVEERLHKTGSTRCPGTGADYAGFAAYARSPAVGRALENLGSPACRVEGMSHGRHRWSTLETVKLFHDHQGTLDVMEAAVLLPTGQTDAQGRPACEGTVLHFAPATVAHLLETQAAVPVLTQSEVSDELLNIYCADGFHPGGLTGLFVPEQHEPRPAGEDEDVRGALAPLGAPGIVLSSKVLAWLRPSHATGRR